MEGSCDNNILLSISPLLASRTSSTAAATALVGGLLMGDEVLGVKIVVGLAENICAGLGAVLPPRRVGLMDVGCCVGFSVIGDPTEGVAIVVAVTAVLEVVVVVPPMTSVYVESQ